MIKSGIRCLLHVDSYFNRRDASIKLTVLYEHEYRYKYYSHAFDHALAEVRQKWASPVLEKQCNWTPRYDTKIP